jgi:hypothetical protein
MVQSFEVQPDVYVKVTDNYIELTLRYIVDPKQRRKQLYLRRGIPATARTQ